MLTEGAKQLLGWKSPNFVYFSASHPRLKLLLRNYQLSDDMTFRFSQKEWSEWPLTAEKFVKWLNNVDKKQELVKLKKEFSDFSGHFLSSSSKHINGFSGLQPKYRRMFSLSPVLIVRMLFRGLTKNVILQPGLETTFRMRLSRACIRWQI